MSVRPIIGITADASPEKFLLSRAYCTMVEQCGGAPVILPCLPARAADFVRACQGIILSGGDDPIMSDARLGGAAMHPKAKPVDPQRQEFELAILEALDANTKKAALGICLGMQYMGLHAGGTLDQHLPDRLASADLHWDKREHEVEGELIRELRGSALPAVIHSHHRQAITTAGGMRVVATAPDGVIEAIRRTDREFYVGVQWHPERTADERLGAALIRQFVDAARGK